MDTEIGTIKYMEESKVQQDSTPKGPEGLKKCPFCAELIQPEAVKCRYCGEFLYETGRSALKTDGKKWYYSTIAVIIALLCVGPFALPLVWRNPGYKTVTKSIITAVVLLVTLFCVYLMGEFYKHILDQFSSQLGF